MMEDRQRLKKKALNDGCSDVKVAIRGKEPTKTR